jgi:hypothetical protein
MELVVGEVALGMDCIQVLRFSPDTNPKRREAWCKPDIVAQSAHHISPGTTLASKFTRFNS